ncbi:MAG: putative Radical SAM domain-containing protein [Promethearchaeota archaeon]|nr:MAG: putative Radical SAM domain-containing protein [Candidatus Lokiarchaeota archaeon]
MKTYDIIFIHAPIIADLEKNTSVKIRRGAYIFIPMGIFAIADYLEREGFGVKIINYPLEKYIDPQWSLSEYLKSIEFKICAIDLHWIHNSFGAIHIIRKVKEVYPNAKIVFGGYSASYYHKELLQYYKNIDCVIKGDGEIPLLEYTKAITRQSSNLEDIPNISYKNNRDNIRINPIRYVAKDLDQLNFTNVELLKNHRIYLEESRKIMGISFNLAVGRGCPFNCPLCGGGQRAQQKISCRKKVILRSPEKVVQDITKILDNYNTNSVFFGHGTYPANLSYWKRIFKLIRNEKLDVSGDIEIWRLPLPKEMWREYFKTFNRRHSSISISPRTTSARVQQKIAKICDPTFQFPISQLQDLIKNATLFRMPLRIWLSLGYPFQTYGDILRDFKFTMNCLLKNGTSTIKPITIMSEPYYIFPGSPAFEAPKKFDIDLTHPSLLQIVDSFKNSSISFFYNVINYNSKYFSGHTIQTINKLLFLFAAPMFLTGS